jgi:hypothetical protein
MPLAVNTRKLRHRAVANKSRKVRWPFNCFVRQSNRYVAPSVILSYHALRLYLSPLFDLYLIRLRVCKLNSISSLVGYVCDEVRTHIIALDPREYSDQSLEEGLDTGLDWWRRY